MVHSGVCERLRPRSVYGFVQGAWPFGLVEAVWPGVLFGAGEQG
jgi:hypothetical protein